MAKGFRQPMRHEPIGRCGAEIRGLLWVGPRKWGFIPISACDRKGYVRAVRRAIAQALDVIRTNKNFKGFALHG